MQTAWLANPARPCWDTDGVVARINQAAQQIRAGGGQVIYVQHADADAPLDSAPWQVLAGLHRHPADQRIDKRACDCFAETELGAMLAAAGSTDILIAGFATEFCVDTTVRMAASRGLQVTVLADAHTTSNRPHLDAASIIAHHNWIWSNMAVPAGASVRVIPTAAALQPSST